MILCLNGVDSPEGVRYSSSKTQVLKGNLFSQLSKVLSGNSDLFSIDKHCKDYFVPYFRGRRTTKKQFLVFLHDLFSIKNHPLPSSGSIEDLHKIYQQNENFISQLKNIYRNNNIIVINDQFWKYFYNKAANSRALEVQNFLNLLGLLCKDRNAYIWAHFSDINIWEKAFNSVSKVNDAVLLNLEQWLKYLSSISLPSIATIRLLENISEVRPFKGAIKHLLNRLYPLIGINNRDIFINYICWFNSGYFKTQAQISLTVNILHLLLNSIVSKSLNADEIIKSFYDVRNHFRSLILDEAYLENVHFLKKVILWFLPVTRSPNLANVSKKTLITFYISSKYHTHMIRSKEEVGEKLYQIYMSDNGHSYFHEAFFSALFIKYETPWYFIRNLENMDEQQFFVLFELIKGQNLRSLIKPPFPVTKKELHLFHNFPRKDVFECQSFINTGLFWAKFKNVGFCDWLHNSMKNYIEQRITIDQFIEHYDFYMALFDYIKKNEETIDPEQVVPILDFIINQYEQEDLERLTFKDVSINRLLREMEFWHISLQTAGNLRYLDMKKVKWRGLNILNIDIEFEKKKYSIIQIKSLSGLLDEGRAMNHCVFSYHKQCMNGMCSIWSLRIKTKNGLKRLATIEVRGNHIVQVRKNANRMPEQTERYIISEWAKMTGLHENFI